MNRIVKLSMCFLLMLGVSSIQGVGAEEPTTYTGDAEGDNTKDVVSSDVSSNTFSTNSNEVIEKIRNHEDLREFSIQINMPEFETIKINDYILDVTLSDQSMFSNESIKSLGILNEAYSCGEVTSFIRMNYLHPLKSGTVTLNFVLRNKNNPSEVYYAKETHTFKDPLEGKQLVVSKNEFTTMKDGLLIYEINGTGYEKALNNKQEEFRIGFVDENGDLIDSDKLTITSSDAAIAAAGNINEFDDDNLKAFYSDYISEFHTNSEYIDAVWKQLSSINSCGGFGWADDGNNVSAILPRNAGTAYITYSYGTQSVTVKVNVTNLTDEPLETLPSDLSKEFFSDANEKINVNLSKADTVSSDIFASVLESGKEVTFNILGENNRTQYAWTFNGATITNHDIDLNLSLVFTSDLKDKIENLAVDKNILYLTFAHHGELPGIAKMKVDVSSQYKDGEEIFLYYYNEETGKAEQTGDKVIVKDGYAEFEISHCSTYYFTSELNENTEKVEPTTPSTDNNVKSDVTSDVKANAEVKKDNNAIKDTGLDTVATTQGIAISMLIFALLGLAVIEKRKHSQVN